MRQQIETEYELREQARAQLPSRDHETIALFQEAKLAIFHVSAPQISGGRADH